MALSALHRVRQGLRGHHSPTTWGIALAAASAAIFGAHSPAERGVYACGGNVALVLVVTTWMRALVLGGYCAATRKPLFQTREDCKQALIGGAFQMAASLGTFIALLYLSAPIVIIIAFSHTLMLLFFLAWRGEIKLDPITVATTVTALGGLSLVIDLWHHQPASSWLGIGIMFLSALATVSRLYVYGHQTKARNPAVVGAENFLIAAILSVFVLCVSPPHVPTATMGYVWLAVAALSLALGTFCMFYAISLLGSFRYSLFAKLEPVFTSLFSLWFLGEALKPQQYAGIAVVMASLALYQIVGQRGRKDA